MLAQFRWPLAATALAVTGALVLGGFEAALIVSILGILEISLSFDNAVVNASILQRMSPYWQRLFLTVGIVIAVFGMRMVFPLLIVGVAGGIGPLEVFELALNQPRAYQERLAAAQPSIAAFGGVFLLMIFLDFLFTSRDVLWIKRLERGLARAGAMDRITVLIALVALLIVAFLADAVDKTAVLISGLTGLAVYLAVNGLADVFESEARLPLDDVAELRDISASASGPADMTRATGKGAFFLFLYLEVLDASFSFDGVVGAFAITSNIFIIAAGLGVGAVYIRSMTVYLVRQHTLREYVYLEHGAHYAIGALALLLLASIRYEVPDVVTGLVGVGFIGLAFLTSLRKMRHERAASATASAGMKPG